MNPKEYRKAKRDYEKRRGVALSKIINTMNLDELKEAYKFARAENSNKRALRCLERMAVLETDLKALKNIRLELADISFDSGELEKAESFYADFQSLYPGSQEIEYAEYKGILSSFYQTLDADFDQKKTRETIQLSQAFNQKGYKQYSLDVAAITKECKTTLFNSEVNIINFYLDKNKLDGAQQRLANLKKEFSSLPGTQATVASLEYALAKKQNNDGLMQEAKLSLDHIKDQSSPVLAQHVDKKSYANRF
jgi:outer membrane assembly lipoprotein YfiO